MAEGGKGAVVAEAPVDQMLVEKLSNPQTIEQLVRLLDRLESVAYLFDMLESFMRRGPEFANSINDLVVMMRQNVTKPEYLARFENAYTAVRRIQDVLDSPQVQELFKSDVLDTRAVGMVGKMSRSMMQAAEETAQTGTKRVGLFGLMRALNDPEVQPALNFLLHFVRHLAKELKDA